MESNRINVVLCNLITKINTILDVSQYGKYFENNREVV